MQGSDFPVAVTSGYYSIGGGSDNTTRVAQLPCEPGWFCVAGRKYPCPAGTFGNAKKLTSRYCSGWCPAGKEGGRGVTSVVTCSSLDRGCLSILQASFVHLRRPSRSSVPPTHTPRVALRCA